jgi:hypothetical protein
MKLSSSDGSGYCTPEKMVVPLTVAAAALFDERDSRTTSVTFSSYNHVAAPGERLSVSLQPDG